MNFIAKSLTSIAGAFLGKSAQGKYLNAFRAIVEFKSGINLKISSASISYVFH